MQQPQLTDRKRKAFEAMFVELGAAKSDGRKEYMSRVMFALMEPMSTAQQAMNDYKTRFLHATEAGDTLAGLAAVFAFQRDLLACVSKDLPKGLLRQAQTSMLKRAAGIASEGGFLRELSMQASPVAEASMMRAFEEFMDEKLSAMDAEIAAAKGPSGPLP